MSYHAPFNMTKPRIAIATPSRDTWSETFIAAHLARLRDVVLVLSGASLPDHANDEALMAPKGLAGRVRQALALRQQQGDWRQLLRRRIVQRLKEAGAEVLLAEYGPTGEALREVAQEAGVPLVVHFHGYDAHRADAVERHGGYAQLLRDAAAIVVVSRAMERQLLGLGAPRERLHYICYGIDTDRFTPGDPGAAAPHFTAVGRFTGKKAPILTLLAFHRAWQQHPEARLTMVGQGDLWEGVWQLRRALGLEAAVDLPGVLPPERIAELLRNSRAFVQHSVTASTGDMEGTPLAVLEAMACGLPVVATHHAGIPDVVQHGASGLLSAEFDVEDMARHLVRLIKEPALATSLGQAGRAAVLASHRVEVQLGKLQQVLESTVR